MSQGSLSPPSPLLRSGFGALALARILVVKPVPAFAEYARTLARTLCPEVYIRKATLPEGSRTREIRTNCRSNRTNCVSRLDLTGILILPLPPLAGRGGDRKRSRR